MGSRENRLKQPLHREPVQGTHVEKQLLGLAWIGKVAIEQSMSLGVVRRIVISLFQENVV